MDTSHPPVEARESPSNLECGSGVRRPDADVA